jgi:excisionase family DNA binding protein
MSRPDPQFFDRPPVGTAALVTTGEAAKLLGVSVSAMRRLQQARAIPFFKVGRCVRFDRSDLAAYLAERRVAPIG